MGTIFRRSYRVLAVLFLCLSVLLPGCGGGSGVTSSDLNNGSIKVSIAIPGQISGSGIVSKMSGISDVASVTVDVLKGASYLQQGVALTLSNGVWSATINNLPMNTNLTFVAHAYDNKSNQIFSGNCSKIITSTSNSGNPITIPMSPVATTTNFPIISGISLPASLNPSQQVSISVSVSGSSNETLTYSVTDNSGGTYSPSSGNVTLSGTSGTINLTYTGPSSTGTYTDSITVTNSQGNSVTQNFVITVSTASSVVQVQFAPAVTSVNGNRSGSNVSYTAVVSSPNNDAVSYQWSFSGTSGVTFNPSTSTPGTLTNYSQTVTGTVTLTVTDQVTNLSSTITFTLSAGQFPDSPVTYTNPITLASISVTPANPRVVWQATQQFIATGTYVDGSTKDLTTAVTWNSFCDPVSNGGLATANNFNSCAITATSSGISNTATLTAYCALPTINCGSICVNPTNDNSNCGACGKVCQAGQTCTNGACM